ncbi:MAG: OmpA family protein, partial [Nevskiales bacterium]
MNHDWRNRLQWEFKMKKFSPHLIVGLAAVALLAVLGTAGCSNTKAEGGGDPSDQVQSSEGGAGLGTEGLDDRSLVGIAPDQRAAFNDPNNPLSVRVFYFEYDSDLVRSDYDRALQAHADYIKQSKTRLTIRLEGHADERGSREYNIALGERRGNAIKKALQLKGVSSDQLAV